MNDAHQTRGHGDDGPIPRVGVSVEEDPGVPEGHIALRFGDPTAGRASGSGTPKLHVEEWLVPSELCIPVTLDLKH